MDNTFVRIRHPTANELGCFEQHEELMASVLEPTCICGRASSRCGHMLDSLGYPEADANSIDDDWE